MQAAVDQFPEEPRRVLQGPRLPPARQDALLWGGGCQGGGGAQRVLSHPWAGAHLGCCHFVRLTHVPILPGDVQGFREHCPEASRGADLQRGLAEGVLKHGTCPRSRGTTDQSVKLFENMGMKSQCYLLSPLKSYSLLIANLSFVLWNIPHFCSIYILISAVRPVPQQVNINVLKVICEQTSPDTSGEVCWPTLSRWCALCTRLALIIALPLPIVQCLAGICPLLASISVKGGPSHLLSKTNRTNWVQSSINWQLP